MKLHWENNDMQWKLNDQEKSNGQIEFLSLFQWFEWSNHLKNKRSLVC